MKVAIVGATEITDYKLLCKAIKLSGFTITEVVSGGAPGVDTLAVQYADEQGIPKKIFKAEWDNLSLPGAEIRTRYNKWKKRDEKYVFNAGFLRNTDIIQYAEAVIALPGEGGGTRDSIKKAKDRGIPLYIYEQPESEKNYDYEF